MVRGGHVVRYRKIRSSPASALPRMKLSASPVGIVTPVCTSVPVQSNYTSYYWEPVRSYTYSSYYDPCTCTCQSVATPVTSYRLRSQCNSVTNYVQRISYRPVTTYRQSCYLEAVPVNPCCPTAPAAAPAFGAPAGPLVAVPPMGGTPPLNLQTPEPALNEQRTIPNTGAPAPGLSEDRSYYGNTIPPLTGQSLRPSLVPTPVPAIPVRPGQIALRPTTNGAANLSGQVVGNNFTPRGGAQTSRTKLLMPFPASGELPRVHGLDVVEVWLG